MTNIQWRIYDFIKERSLEGKWTSQKEIRDYLINKNFVDKIGLRTIRKYVHDIREDDTIQKIILTDYVKGYRLMSDEEELDYLKKRKISILKMLKQYYKDVKRFNQNNQFKITFGKYEREYIESLINVENKDSKGGD